MSTKSTDNKNGYNKKERIKSGLIAMFPSLESYMSFVEENKERIGPFISLAGENRIIGGKRDEKVFKNFIKKNSLKLHELTPQSDLSIGTLLQDRSKIASSVRELTDRINELIKEFKLAQMVPSGKVTYAMFSRLQREPINTRTKRNYLRLLSFEIGYRRPYLGRSLNYEILIKLCPEEYELERTEGVRIAFDLYSGNDIIEKKTIRWLKKEIFDCIKDLGNIKNQKIHAYSTKWFYLDLPKKSISQERFNYLKSYNSCLKASLIIAQQIVLRWLLSPYSLSQRILTIGIAAGEFANLDKYIHSIIKAKVPANSQIYITDYTRLCVLANNIGAICSEAPEKKNMANGETLKIWKVKDFSNTYSWNLVQVLLDDEVLQMYSVYDQTARTPLFCHHNKSKSTFDDKGLNAIASYLRNPQNTILGVEIAKILYFKRRFKAAIEMLQFILRLKPSCVPARILKMEINWIMGMEALSYSVSDIHFRKAEIEAGLIEEICKTKMEEYFLEYALGKMGQAMTILRLIRKGRGQHESEEIILTKEEVYKSLDKAEKIFEMGISIADEGYHFHFLLLYTRSMKRILRMDQDIFKDPDKFILDKHEICKKTAQELYLSLGWLDANCQRGVQSAFMNILLDVIKRYDESVLLVTSIPNIKFHFAAILWDFSLVIDVGIAKRVLAFLKEACEMAKKVDKKNLCMISWLRCQKEIVSVDVLVSQIQNAINEVEVRTGKLEELERKEETEVINEDRLGGLKLFCLNF